MSVEAAKRSAPDHIHPDRQKRARFDPDPELREGRDQHQDHAPRSTSLPRAPAAHRQHEQVNQRPKLNRSATDRSVYDRREDRDQSRRQSHDFYRPSLPAAPINERPSGTISYKYNHDKSMFDRDGERRRSPGWVEGSTTTSGSSSPALSKAADPSIQVSTPKSPIMATSSTSIAAKVQRKDSIVSPNSGLSAAPATVPTIAPSSTDAASKRKDAMMLPEQLVNDVLNGLPVLIQSSIIRSQAYEAREKVQRNQSQFSKFFDQNSPRWQEHERALKNFNAKCEQADAAVREGTDSVKNSLLKLFEKSTSATDVVSQQDYKRLEQTVMDLAAKHKDFEMQIEKKDQQIATLKDRANTQVRTATCHAKNLDSMNAGYDKLQANCTKLEKQICAVDQSVVALRTDQASIAKAVQDVKTDNEASVKGVLRDAATIRALDLEAFKKIPAEFESLKHEINRTCDTIRFDIKSLGEELKQSEEAGMQASVELEKKLGDSVETSCAKLVLFQSQIAKIEEIVQSSTAAPIGNISATEEVVELKAQLETVRTGLSDLQDLVEVGLVDEGVTHPSLVERQTNIENRLDHCEALRTEIESLQKQVKDIKGVVQLSSPNSAELDLIQNNVTKLFAQVRSFEQDIATRQQEDSGAQQQQYDPQSLDKTIKGLRAERADTASIDELRKNLADAWSVIDQLKQQHVRTQPELRMEQLDTVTANLKAELRTESSHHYAGLRQELHTAINNAMGQYAPLSQAVRQLNYRYDTLNSTQMAKQILDQLTPRILAERDPVVHQLQMGLTATQQNVGNIQQILHQTSSDFDTLRRECKEGKNQADDIYQSKLQALSAELYDKFEQWSLNSKERMMTDLDAHVDERVKTSMDAGLHQSAFYNATQTIINEAMEKFSTIEDMKILEDRIQELEEARPPRAAVAELQSKVERLRSKVDGLMGNPLGILQPSMATDDNDDDDNGEGLNIRGQAVRSPTSASAVSNVEHSRKMLSHQHTPTPMQQLNSGGNSLFSRITRDDTSPSASSDHYRGFGGNSRSMTAGDRFSPSRQTPGGVPRSGSGRKKKRPLLGGTID